MQRDRQQGADRWPSPEFLRAMQSASRHSDSGQFAASGTEAPSVTSSISPCLKAYAMSLARESSPSLYLIRVMVLRTVDVAMFSRWLISLFL